MNKNSIFIIIAVLAVSYSAFLLFSNEEKITGLTVADVDYYCEWSWPQGIKDQNTGEILHTCSDDRPWCNRNTVASIPKCCKKSDGFEYDPYHDCIAVFPAEDFEYQDDEAEQPDDFEYQEAVYSCEWSWPQGIKDQNTGQVLYTCLQSRPWCNKDTVADNPQCCQKNDAGYYDCVSADMSGGGSSKFDDEVEVDYGCEWSWPQAIKNINNGEILYSCTLDIPYCNKDTVATEPQCCKKDGDRYYDCINAITKEAIPDSDESSKWDEDEEEEGTRGEGETEEEGRTGGGEEEETPGEPEEDEKEKIKRYFEDKEVSVHLEDEAALKKIIDEFEVYAEKEEFRDKVEEFDLFEKGEIDSIGFIKLLMKGLHIELEEGKAIEPPEEREFEEAGPVIFERVQDAVDKYVNVKTNFKVYVEGGEEGKEGVKEILDSFDTDVGEKIDVVLSGFATTEEEIVSITIKEDKSVYSLTKSRKAKLFGLIPLRLDIITKINSKDMTIISEKKPWWSFLTIDKVGESNPQPSP